MSELWVNSKIDKDWLEWFGESWRVYERQKHEKSEIEKRINSLKSIDYSKDKVNGRPSEISEQERYILRLEKINTAIAECEKILFPAKERLKQQIQRIKKAEYRKLLILRYVERWKWSDVVEEFFWYEDNFDKNDSKFKDKVMQWNRAAVTKLEELNNKPYVPVNEQLHIEV